jgi:glutamine synthetase
MGWATVVDPRRIVDESDMLLIPNFSTAQMDPYTAVTLVLICNVKDPITGKAYTRDLATSEGGGVREVGGGR